MHGSRPALFLLSLLAPLLRLMVMLLNDYEYAVRVISGEYGEFRVDFLLTPMVLAWLGGFLSSLGHWLVWQRVRWREWPSFLLGGFPPLL